MDGKRAPIAKDVLNHFRNSTSIRSLSRDVSIDVLADEFSDRQRYLQLTNSAIQSRQTPPGIVFLDPDTGLEAESGKLGLAHVSKAELGEIWQTLGSRDLLVFYQHQDN